MNKSQRTCLKLNSTSVSLRNAPDLSRRRSLCVILSAPTSPGGVHQYTLIERTMSSHNEVKAIILTVHLGWPLGKFHVSIGQLIGKVPHFLQHASLVCK